MQLEDFCDHFLKIVLINLRVFLIPSPAILGPIYHNRVVFVAICRLVHKPIRWVSPIGAAEHTSCCHLDNTLFKEHHATDFRPAFQ